MGLYILASYRAAPLLVRLASLCLTAGLYIGWYSYCTTSWGRVFPTVDDDYFLGYGVWRIGDNQFQATAISQAPLPSISHTDGWLLGWYGAFQAFATLGFVSVNLGYFLLVLVIYVGPCKTNVDLVFWNAINNLLGCVSWLVAVIVFGVRFQVTFDLFDVQAPVLDYSFYLAVVTCGLQLTAALLLLFSTSAARDTTTTTTTAVDSLE